MKQEGCVRENITYHDMASSGRAPLSLPSNSCPVLMNTEKSAPCVLDWFVYCFILGMCKKKKRKEISIHTHTVYI